MYIAQFITDHYLWNYEQNDQGWFRYVVRKKLVINEGVLIIRNSRDPEYFTWILVNIKGSFVKGDRLNIEWRELTAR